MGRAGLRALQERLSFDGMGSRSGSWMDNMASIKIRVAEDGTCSICRDGTIISSGLTRSQADQMVAVLRAIEGHA
ncbi:UNVERIFIED_ORG: hypothetical protein M2438_000721 [Methylobacterium sp. SuP10 SLI 274]|jgi:hypothetical protein|nr:hypothetical protein [Methylorubrum extorquens]MDF9861928.1 hypothetical protein [Methylorubrum pseudosasae]MDH6635546.1 hypothetical protein [Methylobacterium sp. SuP10 SLI 274]MDH6664722.1 hypothetical protein [Methylorubrum zatmanii]